MLHRQPPPATRRSAPVHSPSHLTSAQRGYIGDKTPGSRLPSGDLPSGDLMARALDELACGVIIIDAQSRVLHQNLAAHAVLARGDCMAIDDGVISVSHAPDEPQLKDALAKAAQGKRSMIALGALSRTTVAVVPLQR
jgi:hypothetical protein